MKDLKWWPAFVLVFLAILLWIWEFWWQFHEARPKPPVRYEQHIPPRRALA